MCKMALTLFKHFSSCILPKKKEKEENIFPLTQAHQPFNGETFVMYIF